MFDAAGVREQLGSILEALERIPRRMEGIKSADEFVANESNREHLDSICMLLIAVGEACKQIDRKTAGELFAKYPQVDWVGIKGVRDVIAHGYFDIDAEQIFAIVRDDVPRLITTLRQMMQDLQVSEPPDGGSQGP